MKLCDTCIYRNNVEQLKPCIIYRDDCEYYEKERGDMADDLISREAVIYYIKGHIHEIITESGEDKNAHTNRVLRALINGVETMPPVNPQEPKWIPVSERLPKKESRYLTTILNEYDNELRYIMTCDYFSNGCWCPDDECASSNVIAWMPLPEPYKAESEDNE